MSGDNPIGVLGLYFESPDAPRCQTIQAPNFTNRSWAELVLMFIETMQPTPLEPASLLTTNNINNLTVWMSQENNSATWWGTGGANNPLNNSLGSGAAFGLGSYPDLVTAAYYAAKEICSPGHGFPAIVAALRSDASPTAFSTAVVQSGWACSHYGVKAAGSDNCTEGNHVPDSPYQDEVPKGYWTAGASGPAGDPAWWGAGLAQRGLNYLSTLPVPNEVTAPGIRGFNPSTSNGVGWAWQSPQAWQPNPGVSFPAEPKMSPVPDLVSIDPSNPATYDAATGFGQTPSAGSSGSQGGAGGAAGGAGSGSQGSGGPGGGSAGGEGQGGDPTTDPPAGDPSGDDDDGD